MMSSRSVRMAALNQPCCLAARSSLPTRWRSTSIRRSAMADAVTCVFIWRDDRSFPSGLGQSERLGQAPLCVATTPLKILAPVSDRRVRILGRKHAWKLLDAGDQGFQIVLRSATQAEVDIGPSRPRAWDDPDRAQIETAMLDGVQDRGDRVDRLVQFYR